MQLNRLLVTEALYSQSIHNLLLEYTAFGDKAIIKALSQHSSFLLPLQGLILESRRRRGEEERGCAQGRRLHVVKRE